MGCSEAGAVELEQIILGVPARLGSTRLPRKLLRSVGAQSVVGHSCDRLKELRRELQSIEKFAGVSVLAFVATDSEEIAEVVREKNLTVVLTSSELPNGTQRMAAACHKLGLFQGEACRRLVVNLQGDEPFVNVSDICRLVREHAAVLAAVPMGTLVYRQRQFDAFLDASVVKVVRRADGSALYFSRAPIPWPRQAFSSSFSAASERSQWKSQLSANWFFWQHLGIYAYRADFLRDYTEGSGAPVSQGRSCEPDQQEGLEQLDVLQQGHRIWISEAEHHSVGIDTAADLERVRREHASPKGEN